jgi:hypothetical protein
MMARHTKHADTRTVIANKFLTKILNSRICIAANLGLSHHASPAKSWSNTKGKQEGAPQGIKACQEAQGRPAEGKSHGAQKGVCQSDTAHWRSVLPAPGCAVQYEHLIDDREAVSRRLVEFVGLYWNEACLHFHESKAGVPTASKWQVRQPIYKTSAGRWRKYEKHLRPLFTALGIDLAEHAKA